MLGRWLRLGIVFIFVVVVVALVSDPPRDGHILGRIIRDQILEQPAEALVNVGECEPTVLETHYVHQLISGGTTGTEQQQRQSTSYAHRREYFRFALRVGNGQTDLLGQIGDTLGNFSEIFRRCPYRGV